MTFDTNFAVSLYSPVCNIAGIKRNGYEACWRATVFVRLTITIKIYDDPAQPIRLGKIAKG